MAPARLLLAPAIAALSLASPLAAQHITSPYRYIESRQYVSVFGGPIRTQTGGAALGPTNGRIFGAQFGYRVSGPFVVELGIAYAPLERVVRDTLRSGTDTTTFQAVGSGPAKQGVLLPMATLRFDLTGSRTWYGLQPYLLLGAGGALGTSSANGADTSVPQDVRFRFGTSFAAQAGGGFEFYATRHIGLRFDGRGTLWKLHTPQAFQVRDRTLPPSEWAQNVTLVGGLALHF